MGFPGHRSFSPPDPEQIEQRTSAPDFIVLKLMFVRSATAALRNFLGVRDLCELCDGNFYEEESTVVRHECQM